MIRYTMNNRDALRSYMMAVPTAQARYSDPNMQQFRTDETEGLCRIRYVRPYASIVDAQAAAEIEYRDPELEMLRRLSL
jgi:hypothetical protein